MGLFERIFRRSGERKREDGDRCMECGMTGGKHTDWCPVVPEAGVEDTPDTIPEEGPEAEGQTESHR